MRLCFQIFASRGYNARDNPQQAITYGLLGSIVQIRTNVEFLSTLFQMITVVV